MRFFKPNIDKLQAKKDLTGLVKALRDPETSIRQNAASALGEVGDPRAIDPLIAAFGDADKEVRKSALRALVKIGAQAVRPLMVALKSEVALERVFAAWSLGDIGDSQALEPLATALKDEDSGVRYNAVYGLGKIGGERVIAPLITALGDPDQDVRRKARELLIKLGPPSVDLLIAALSAGSEYVRLNAAWILGDIGDTRAVEPLIAATQDVEGAVRQNASSSLGQIGDARAGEALIQVLGDSYEPARQQAISALARICLDIQTQNALIAALSDPDSGVRRHNARVALEKIHLDAQTHLAAQAQSALFALLQHADAGMRQFAVQKLDELGWQPDDGEMGARYWARKHQWDECVRIGTPAVEALIAELNVKPDKTIIQALARIGDARAIQPLIAICTRDRDASGKLGKQTLDSIAIALGSFGKPALASILQTVDCRSLVDKHSLDSNIDEVLLSSLFYMTDSQTLEPLITILNSCRPYESPRRQDFYARAAEALGKIGDPRAVESLIIALKADPAVCSAAVRALGQIRDMRTVEPLISALQRWASDLRKFGEAMKEAIETLAQFGDRRACEPVIDALFMSIHQYEDPSFWQDLYQPLHSLFADYTGLIIDLISFEVKYEERTYYEEDQDWYEDRYAGGRRESSRTTVVRKHTPINNLRALEILCRNVAPVSSNLLHKVKNIGTEIADELTKRAGDELTRRGNPSYDPSVYLDPASWKIPEYLCRE